MCSGVPCWCRELFYFPSQKLHAARAIKLMAKKERDDVDTKLMAKKERDDVDTGRRREKGLLVGICSVRTRTLALLRTFEVKSSSESFLPTARQRPTANCHRQRNNQQANSHNPIAVACFLPTVTDQLLTPTTTPTATIAHRRFLLLPTLCGTTTYNVPGTCIKSSHERR